ncbi:hypothetical protein [Nocardia callitridis]|uniref:hypothetical protein n=1 Tax=Nocardia callitridis TaxID=648753 RepID=UPI0031E57DFA
MVLNGQLMGYLWASVGGNAAGYLRHVAVDDDNLTCPGFWNDRLDQQYRQGLSAEVALRQWAGVPEDPRCGGVPPHAQELEASTKQELWSVLNPTATPMDPGPWIQDGEFPSGTPEDRSKGWSAPVSVTPATYASNTAAEVRYYPVTKSGQLLGFLWAAAGEQSAEYLPLASAGPAGTAAAGLWNIRLSDAFSQGIPALEAIRRFRRYPPDMLAGVIGTEAHEQSAASLSDLESIAGQG